MKIAKFEKVSFEQFEKDWLKNFPDTNDVKAVYDSIKLPKRATTGSAGYDFMLRQTFALKKENRLLFRQVFAQKLTRAGFFQFIHAQVSVLSIAVSLTIQSELLILIIIIPQTRAIL